MCIGSIAKNTYKEAQRNFRKFYGIVYFTWYKQIVSITFSKTMFSFATLLTGFNFVRSNINIILIVGGVLLGSIFLYKVYTVIEHNGEMKSIIAVQEETIKNKNNQIDSLRKINALNEQIIVEKDKEVEDLESQLDGITKELGSDANDLAPEAIRELFRRLQIK